MAGISGYDSSSMSTLLSGLGTGSSKTSSANGGLYGINVIDYSSIQNGSYGKLMKAYYNLDETDDAKKSNSKNDTDDTDQTLKSIKNATGELKESAQALYSDKGLFAANADGEYNMEAIYDKVNAFIENYNEAVNSMGSAETESIAKAGANMVNAVNGYSDMLSRMGITISSGDYSLSINKEKFMESGIADIKSVFSGVGSLSYQIGAKASRMEGIVAEKVSSGVSFSGGSSTATSSSTSKDSASTIAKIKDNANTFVATGTDLYKNTSLFRKNADNEYDTEEILEEVSAFIKDYNSLLGSTENSKVSAIANAVTTMTNVTDTYEKMLSEIGIHVDENDNSLILNEDTFLKSDMSEVKDLFHGTGSYSYQVTVKAAMIANQAETEANKANTYTNTASYANNYNTGNIFNGIV
uniref:hypothetical protein n=1 Tax=Agathobacter sp. TaxID=2021311 RepID=UPI004057B49B